jgi:hypothetical protein
MQSARMSQSRTVRFGNGHVEAGGDSAITASVDTT